MACGHRVTYKTVNIRPITQKSPLSILKDGSILNWKCHFSLTACTTDLVFLLDVSAYDGATRTGYTNLMTNVMNNLRIGTSFNGVRAYGRSFAAASFDIFQQAVSSGKGSVTVCTGLFQTLHLPLVQFSSIFTLKLPTLSRTARAICFLAS